MRRTDWLLGFSVALLEWLLSRFLNSTWEWDAVCRSLMAEQPSLPDDPTWLPGWQLGLGLLHRLTGWSTLELGELVSCCMAALTCVCLRRLALRAGASPRRALLTALLPLTSGFFLAYGSQAMTDVTSVALLTLSLCGPTWLTALACLANATLRYEAWGFALLAARRRPLAMLPALIWAVAWLAWSHGSVPERVYLQNGHAGFDFFGNLAAALLVCLANLCLATGCLWLLSRPPWTSLAYLAFLVAAMDLGYSSGWVRHWLYLLPAAALGTLRVRSRRVLLSAILASALVGAFSLAWNVQRHRAYRADPRVPASARWPDPSR